MTPKRKPTKRPPRQVWLVEHRWARKFSVADTRKEALKRVTRDGVCHDDRVHGPYALVERVRER